MGKEKRIITAEEAIDIIHKKWEIDETVTVKGDIYLTGFNHAIEISGSIIGNIQLDACNLSHFYIHDNGCLKGNIHLYKNSSISTTLSLNNVNGNAYLWGSVNNFITDCGVKGKIYTDQRNIAEIAHFAGIPVIISLKDYKGEK